MTNKQDANLWVSKSYVGDSFIKNTRPSLSASLLVSIDTTVWGVLGVLGVFGVARIVPA
jgi:hypothetical protein